MNKLSEAEKKEFMTKREQALKKRLIALLKDDGKGHKHARYAERLADFDIKIVPLGYEPETAAISFDEGLIYINEGFLSDPDTFFQLNVLMRHEMAHNLLMHQIRMARQMQTKYGKNGETRIALSKSLHELNNIIEDFEISNTRYTAEDKLTVKNMYLNGELIGGLITEEHRKDWENMSVEDMYKAVTDEIDAINQKILDRWQQDGQLEIEKPTDYIDLSEKKLYTIYANSDRSIQFSGRIADFFRNKCLYHFAAFDGSMPCIVKLSSLPEEWQKLAKTVYEAYSKNGVQAGDIRDMLLKICKSSPTEVCPITDPLSGEIAEELYTPEDKLLAGDILFALLAEMSNAGEKSEEANSDAQCTDDNETQTDDNKTQSNNEQNEEESSASGNELEDKNKSDSTSEGTSDGENTSQKANNENSERNEIKQDADSGSTEASSEVQSGEQDSNKQDKAESSESPKQTWREKVRNGLIDNGYSKDDVRTILSKVNAQKIKN